MFWAQVIMFAISLIVAIVTRPRAPQTKSLTLQDFDIPTAEEDRSIPVIFGTQTITGPNVVWHGDFEPDVQTKDGVKTRNYYLGMHFVACYGPIDSLLKIMVDTSDVYTTPVTANSTITLNKPDLFGGRKAEGGIAGPLNVMLGGSGQTANTYLTAKQGANQPAYFGVVSLIYQHGLVSANSSYLKPWSFKCKRILQGWISSAGTTAWYPEKAEVLDELSEPSGDMNAVHVLYECITNRSWGGMRRSPTMLDDANWRAAADTCYTEGMGISTIWVREGPVEDFIRIILDHIGAAIGQDMSTGKITITLIRDDYDHGGLTLLDESIIIDMPSFERPGQGEIVNQVILTYVDQATNKAVPLADHNLASIQSQGFTVSESIDRSMFSRVDVAGRALTRELKARSTPLAKGTITCNREHWKTIIPGSVFGLQWAKRNIGFIIIRITDVDYGDIENNMLTVQFVEDIYGLADANYIALQPSLYDEDTTPDAISVQGLYEAPYWMARQVLGPIYGPIMPPGPGWITTVAARQNYYEIDYDMWSRKDVDAYALSGKSMPFNNTAQLSAALGQASANVSVGVTASNLRTDMEFPKTAILGNNPNAGEFIAITGATVSDGVVTAIDCIRALWDTTAAHHPAGTRLWLLDGVPLTIFNWPYGNEYVGGDFVDAKILPRTDAGMLDISAATEMSLQMVYRHVRPYPPGGVNIDAVEFPAIAAAGFTVTWVHRNRLSELVNAQWSPSDGPEANTQYAGEIYDDTTDTLLDSSYNMTGLSWTPTLSCPAGTRLRLVLWSGIGIYLFSWQKQIRIFDYISTSGLTTTADVVEGEPGGGAPPVPTVTAITDAWSFACSDETATPLTTGVKITDRAPYAFRISGVKATLVTPQVSGTLISIDVKVEGVSIFSTLLTFDNTHDTTVTATTPAAIEGGYKDLAENDKFTIEIVTVGSETVATGLKVHLINGTVAAEGPPV